MAAVLTYHLRRGLLTGVASGKYFHLPTHQDPSGVTAWGKDLELRPGKVSLFDHSFEAPHKHGGASESLRENIVAGRVSRRVTIGSIDKLEIDEYPGPYVDTFADAEKAKLPNDVQRPSKHVVNHAHFGPAVFVAEKDGGFYIHGWPPCNLKKCVVVMHQWNDLLQAIAHEKSLSFHIEY